MKYHKMFCPHCDKPVFLPVEAQKFKCPNCKSDMFAQEPKKKPAPIKLGTLPKALAGLALLLIVGSVCVRSAGLGVLNQPAGPETPANTSVAGSQASETRVLPTPIVTPAPQRLVIANTGGSGVYIRRTPSSADTLKAWPEGTIMVLIGADQQGEGKTWRHVKDPDGTEGWMPAEYLAAATATP